MLGIISTTGTILGMRAWAVAAALAVLIGCSNTTDSATELGRATDSPLVEVDTMENTGELLEKKIKESNCAQQGQSWCSNLSKVVVDGRRLAVAYIDAPYHPSSIETAKKVCKALQEAFEVAANPWRGASVMAENWLLVYTKGVECQTVSEFENIDTYLEYQTDGQNGPVKVVLSNEVPFDGAAPSRISDIQKTKDCAQLLTWFEEGVLISESAAFSPLTRQAYDAYAAAAAERGDAAGCPHFVK